MEALQKFGSVSSYEIYPSHASLLQRALGIESLAKSFGMTAHHFAAAQLRGHSPFPKAVELVAHFRSARLAGFNQRGIEFGQRFLQAGKRFFHRLVGAL